MKKTLFICIVCLCAFIQSKAQKLDKTAITEKVTHKVDAELLFQKAKKQKTAAWLILGSGAVMAITGFAIISSDASYNASQDLGAAFTVIFTFGFATPAPIEYRHSASGPILAIAGTGAMLGSIPLFITSGKNKRKANIMILDESVSFNSRLNLKDHMPSLGVRITF
jgi:hypothetical protein